MGEANTENMQTKVEKVQKYIMVLKYNDFVNQYLTNAFEESIFHIDKKNRLTSQSDEMLCAKYDGIDQDFLIDDIIYVIEL